MGTIRYPKGRSRVTKTVGRPSAGNCTSGWKVGGEAGPHRAPAPLTTNEPTVGGLGSARDRLRLGGSHPLDPLRWELTWLLAENLGVLDGFQLSAPARPTSRPCFWSVLWTTSMRSAAASRPGFRFSVGHGLGTPDNPIFPSMHGGRSADRRGSVAGARAIADGEVDRAVNFHTSLRHAMANHASGFCCHNENEAAQTHRRGAAGRGAQGRPRRRRREPRLADPVLRRPRGAERVHPPEPVVTVPSVHAGGNRIGVLFAVLQLAKLSIIGGHSTSTSSPALRKPALPTAGIAIAIRGYRFAQVGRGSNG
jgi:hypothetical protein